MSKLTERGLFAFFAAPVGSLTRSEGEGLSVGCNLQPHCQMPLNPTHWSFKFKACSDEPTENYHQTAAPFKSTGLYSVVQLIVSVLQPATSLFWLTLTTLIALIPAAAGRYFWQKSSDKLVVHYLTSNKQHSQLATSW